ncbi:MAG: S-layer protein, partial [Nanoarchaeota archaeon]
MKLRKTISKMLALGTGAVMVGATILSATAAADLKSYPMPFVSEGKFNAVLVVGDSAASSDVIGSVDIATSLQFASRVKKTSQSTGGGQVSISGDAWRVQQGAKKLEFSETMETGAASPRQEVVRNITTFIGKDELPNLLASGTFSNTQGDYDYRQYMYFDTNPPQANPGASMSVVYAEDPDTNTAADYFYIKNSESVVRYALEFTETAKTDVTDSSGS